MEIQLKVATVKEIIGIFTIKSETENVPNMALLKVGAIKKINKNGM